MTGIDITRRSPAPAMGLWRLEWLRLVRTGRGAALLLLFLLLGLGDPFSTKYLGVILSHAASGAMTVTVPAPTAAQGVTDFVRNISQLGLMAVVVIATASTCPHHRPRQALFYRSRERRTGKLLLPRIAVTSAATLSALLLGFLGDWYTTALLIGTPKAAPMLETMLLVGLYALFAVALVSALGALLPGALATVLTSCLILLFGMPLLGLIPHLADVLPSHLVTAPAAVMGGSPLSDSWPAMATTAVLTALLAAVAPYLAARREAA